MLTDTIAAIATATGPGGIGIVRVSGPDSLDVADRLFVAPAGGHPRRPSAHPGGTFLHGFIRPADTKRDGTEPVDEVVLLIYRAPKSYTREDVIEIQAHGGRLSSQRVLRQVLACGARLSDPGEFTRRAFINGRIDLTQAEAVMDLISAECDRAASSAVMQLRGDIRHSIEKIYDDTTDTLSALEASLDFPEDDIPDRLVADGMVGLARAIRRAEELAATWQEGKVLREGRRVVIAGRPNVGKSTLLNAILRSERAIVSDIPGTTRDTIEETAILSGIPVHLIDTAGLRTPSCAVEAQGVRRTLLAVDAADIVLYVMDGSMGLSPEDAENLHRMSAAGGTTRKAEILVILNKQDLGVRLAADDVAPFPSVRCSLLDPGGVEPVVRELTARAGAVTDGPPHAVVSERHYRGLAVTLEHLRSAASLMGLQRDLLQGEQQVTGSAAGASSTDGPPKAADEREVLAAVHLRTAMDQLGQLLGRAYTDDLLDRVFSRFCIGK